MKHRFFERRRFIQSAAFGLIGITLFKPSFGRESFHKGWNSDDHFEPLFYRYPGTSDALASAIVGASHGNFDKVKELVSGRPELAGASWDWGWGDWETALGAASHVGRRDIAEYLIAHGARPDIFTFAMMGMRKSVQEMVETIPGIQTHAGPHGITLMQHAKSRMNDKNISAEDRANINDLVAYLESLGNADLKTKSLEITDDEKQKYLGEYRFGAGDGEIFVVSQNSRKLLQIGRKGSSGRILHKVDNHRFSPAGAPSVNVLFKVENEQAISLVVHEPEPLVTAIRI